MRYEIDSKVLDKYNLSMEQFLYLLINVQDNRVDDIRNSVIENKLADADVFSVAQVVISNNMKDLIAKILIESTSLKTTKEEDSVEDIAKALRECYANHNLKGKKPGTTYPWQSSISEVATKLQVLRVKYKANFTKEEAVDVTNKYIEDFLNTNRGDTRFLPLLKYFILKGKGEDMKSDFMACLDTNGQESTDSSNDWLGELV